MTSNSRFQLPTSSIVCFVVGLLAMPSVLWACPGCKEAVFDPAQAQQSIRLARGYAMSIGLMLLMPTVLVGGVAALIARSRRSKHREIPRDVDTSERAR